MRYSWTLPLLAAIPLATAVPQACKTKTKTETITAAPVTVTAPPVTSTITAPGLSCPTAPVSTPPSGTTTTTTTSAAATYPNATATATTTGKKGLAAYAKGKLQYFGIAADIPGPEQQDAAYMAVLNNANEFNQLTSANYMKYEFTEPQRGVFNYTGGDVILDIAATNGQIVRCHNLVWHQELPTWLTSQTWDNATLVSILEIHVTNLVTHWGSRCAHWDVVNEALNDNGTYRSNLWYDTIGQAYIPIAFRAAQKAAAKGTKLYYNDYNIENPGAKATAAQNIVKSLKAQGIRIDGVGLQSHFIIGGSPSLAQQQANMAAFATLDVDVAITELDVRAQTLPVSLAQQQQQQKVDFYNAVEACVTSARCVGITLWDFDDKYSWIPSTFTGQGYGDPWLNVGDQLVKKSAYDGIVAALTGGTP